MKELFDVVDRHDKVIGTAFREEVHGNPQKIHRVSHVLVFNKQGRLFLQKRSLSKDVQPGKWDTSVGGHLDSGEDYLSAAEREMAEELGIEGAPLFFLYKYLHSNNYESEIVSTFETRWDGPIHILQAEIDEGKFWPFKEIENSIDKGIFTPNFIDEFTRYKEIR
jgi:isopentenyldiphosphate isomerase